MELVQALFDAVRGACSPRSWSRGIELVRGDAVAGERADDEEVTLRVRSPGRSVSNEVTLYPEDEDWQCDCDSTADACEHVAAATIAWRGARKEGRALPSSAKLAGRLGYRLTVNQRRVELGRVIRTGDDDKPLDGTLAKLAAHSDAAVDPTQTDLAIDRLLEQWRVRALAGEQLARLMPLLAQVDDLQLDGEPIVARPEPLLLEGRLRRKGNAVVLRITPPEALISLVVAGVACVRGDGGEGDGGRELRSLAGGSIGGLELERLPIERRFGPHQMSELVGEVLPSLRDQVRVDRGDVTIPRIGGRQAPRLAFDVEHQGAALSVLPLMVYGDPPVARLDGERLVHLGGDELPRRDSRAEERVRERLRLDYDLSIGKRELLTGERAAALAGRLRGYGGPVEGRGQLERYPQLPLTADVKVDGARLQLRFASAEGTLEAAPEEVLQAYERGASLVPLLGGGWAPLPSDWLSRFGPVLAHLLAARDAAGKVASHAQPALLSLCDALEHPRPAELSHLAPLVDGFDGLPRAALPDDLTAELRDYQRVGVDWLSFLREARLGAVLADDMGLGKTLQALCAVRGRVLVVCPTSVVHNWADEIARFRPDLSFSVFHGQRRELDHQADVTLTSYALLRRDIDELRALHWDMVVLDEAQAIKNPDSQVARAAYQLDADFRVAMTGTPLENRLEELWSQLHFANPGLFGGREHFRERYEQPIAAGDAGAAADLRRRIGPFVLRRLKREVARELPPRTDVVMHCELDEDERAVYDALRAATRDKLVAQLEQGGSVLGALEALLRLRQAACHASLVPGQQRERSSKLERLMIAVEQIAAEGSKALVFSQWTSLLDLLEPELERAGVDFTRLDGSTRDRAGVVETFQSTDGPPVMLLSLKAGGTGLNLTAADHVFILDPWWNPAAEDQAADRAHRIGQERPVLVYRLVARDTVEERILALQERKRALAEAALGEADRAAAVTRDDLLELLR
jgi:superfamily II DNA or RNA helicase